MPLISSPIDGSPMREIERYGVRIDICPTSGGIWLDKGELEKIIMMIREEALAEAGAQGASGDRGRQDMARATDASRSGGTRPQGRKRDSMFDNIMDIFDF
jgi:Zn-finger nucleic acid-binding protein